VVTASCPVYPLELANELARPSDGDRSFSWANRRRSDTCFKTSQDRIEAIFLIAEGDQGKVISNCTRLRRGARSGG
jgi:hypothetical protein